MNNIYLKLDAAVDKVMELYMKHGELPVFIDEDREKQMLYNEFYEVCDVPLMRGNEYQELAARTINPDLNNEEAMYHALHGMVGEIGEMHSLYQKAYQGHPRDYDHLKKELGDLLWFVAEYCTAMGWTMEEVMQLNIDKLRARFPEGFTAERSLHRAEGDI